MELRSELVATSGARIPADCVGLAAIDELEAEREAGI